MKLLTKAIIISTALILSSVVMHTFAAVHNPDSGHLVVHNYVIKPTHYNEIHKTINCAPYSAQTYNLTVDENGFKFEGQFELKDIHFYDETNQHGLIAIHWRGVWTYIKPDGKTYPSKAYGVEIMQQGSNEKLGIITNKYCTGSYRATWTDSTKTKTNLLKL